MWRRFLAFVLQKQLCHSLNHNGDWIFCLKTSNYLKESFLGCVEKGFCFRSAETVMQPLWWKHNRRFQESFHDKSYCTYFIFHLCIQLINISISILGHQETELWLNWMLPSHEHVFMMKLADFCDFCFNRILDLPFDLLTTSILLFMFNDIIIR